LQWIEKYLQQIN
jgi:hypothetical protein